MVSVPIKIGLLLRFMTEDGGATPHLFYHHKWDGGAMMGTNIQNHKSRWNIKRNYILYLMLIPTCILLFVFAYMPMYGVVIAFQDFQPLNGFVGSPFVGLYWFKFLFNMPDFKSIIINTLIIAACKIVFLQLSSISFSILLNEVSHRFYKKVIQTVVFLPNFLSWVIIGSIFIDILSTRGVINQFLGIFGVESIFFLGSNQWFRFTLVSTDIWKNFGFNSILYLAALTNINPEYYEAATIDGAGKVKQMWYITLPGIRSTIILLATLSLGNVLNAGFEQILILYNPAVYQTGDIIDTFVYRTGLIDAQFSLSTAVGLFKSVISFFLIVFSYRMAYKYANYRIF